MYNISKLAAESLCISCGKENIKIVRPSNVVGIDSPSNLFIPSIIHEAIDKQKITLRSTLDSEKDFVHIDDVLEILFKISINGKSKIYNIAMGKNTSSRAIIDEISKITGCTVEVIKNAPKYCFPEISIEKIKNEFDFKPQSFFPLIKKMVLEYDH